MINSPFTEDEETLTEYEVYEICFFRIMSSDEEWADDPASRRWDLSREEAATRIDAEDYSAPE